MTSFSRALFPNSLHPPSSLPPSLNILLLLTFHRPTSHLRKSEETQKFVSHLCGCFFLDNVGVSLVVRHCLDFYVLLGNIHRYDFTVPNHCG